MYEYWQLKRLTRRLYPISPFTEERDAAFKVAREAFKGTRLTMKDVDNAVKTVRRKAYGKKK